MVKFIRYLKKVLRLFICFIATCVFYSCSAVPEKGIVDRINTLDKEGQLLIQKAELEIHPDYLKEYLELLQEGITTSVAKEPGVLSLYAMADKDTPNKITVFEVYTSQAAYESHITAPHFLKYKNGTLHMVKKLTLTRTTPIVFASKIK